MTVADCGGSYTIARTWTAIGGCGELICTQTLTVVDSGAPTIICPANITLECRADTSVTANGTATANDACGDATVRHSDKSIPGCGGMEIITRVWTATDECGNTASGAQTITVLDPK